MSTCVEEMIEYARANKREYEVVDQPDLPRAGSSAGRRVSFLVSKLSEPKKNSYFPSEGSITGSLCQPKTVVPGFYLSYVLRKGSARISAFAKLRKSLRLYLTYPDNWDGYEGIRPKIETVVDANSFLDNLPEEFELPTSGLAGNGEISFIWDKNEVYVDIGFIGDHKYSFYARAADGHEAFVDGYEISSGICPELARILKSINQ